jgi:hypothetical protein
MQEKAEYGNDYKAPASVNMAQERGTVKKNIPVAQTNECGPSNKFDSGKTSGVAYVHNRKCSQ